MEKEKLKIHSKRLYKKIEVELTSFQKEFRKHLATFITGAFAFVAALLWNDAIKSILDTYKERIELIMPIKEIWFAKLFIAFVISIVAGIVVISKLLKVEEEK
jgi:hypothetical protein